MKILFVSGNLCDGGAQRVISVVTDQLAKRGHDVSLLLFSRNEKEYPINENIKVTSIGANYAEYSKLSELERIRIIRNYLKETRPQVAVGFIEGGYGLYVSSFGMKFAKVASARIDPAFMLKGKGLRLMIKKMWFRSADAVVLQTERQKEHAAGEGWKRQTVIANPVSDKALEQPTHEYERPCRRIIMAGRLETQKNYPLVLSAMSQVVKVYPDAILDIFGEGSLKETLRDQVVAMGLENNVNICGWAQDIFAEHARHDMYILSSDFEGMPNALMEAMAVGLPCISTDCDTGPEDLITDGENGFLVPVNDVEALTQKLLHVMSMSAQDRRRLGENAHKTLKDDFNSEAIAIKWEDLMTSLLK